MAPNASKYPITTGLFHFNEPPSSVTGKLPQLGSSTSLAHLSGKRIDSYLKDVIHHLKNLFIKFTEIIVHHKLSLTVQSAQGIHGLQLEFTTLEKQMSIKNPTMLQALGLLDQGFFQSNVLLKNIAQIDDVQKLREDDISNLKKLKELLLALSSYLDRVLLIYSNAMMGCKAPSVDDIRRCSKKIYKVINQLNPSGLQHLNPDILVTEEEILCSVLGLEDAVAHRLANLKPSVRGHQSDEYFLLCFLEEHGDYSEVDSNLRDKKAVASKLQGMGFTESRSVVIADWIAEQRFAEHQSLLAWARYYIETLFKCDIFLNDYVARYPYEEGNLNQWFQVSAERYVDEDSISGSEDENGKDEDCIVVHQVKAINLHTQKLEVVEQKIEELQKAQQPGKQFYFHGTDHDSAASILEHGINLGANKRCCDFSDGCGFYLTNSSRYAIEWSKKSEASAVLAFSIKQEDLDNFHCLDLSSHEKNADWEMVINHYRFKSVLPQSLCKEYKNCDYIKGPMSLDSTHQPPHVEQICTKSERMISCIGNANNICGVVFVNAKNSI